MNFNTETNKLKIRLLKIRSYFLCPNSPTDIGVVRPLPGALRDTAGVSGVALHHTFVVMVTIGLARNLSVGAGLLARGNSRDGSHVRSQHRAKSLYNHDTACVFPIHK